MSDLPPTNGEEARAWMNRARTQVELAGFAAGRQYWHEACHHLVRAAELAVKAAHIAGDTPVPRKHRIDDLLSSCPTEAIREQVYLAHSANALKEFSRYYFSVYPDGEDADQGAYVWCSKVAQRIMRIVTEHLP